MDESSADYQNIIAYIDAHPTAVVSTINEHGLPEAAAVYLFTVSHHTVCFVTRNLTQKYQNIFANNNVCFTIFNHSDVSTLQASGKAFIANDEHMLSYTMQKIENLFRVRADTVSPLAKMQHTGDYVLIGIEITHARLRLYQGIDVNMNNSFTEYSISAT